jgi:hypothetical protein
VCGRRSLVRQTKSNTSLQRLPSNESHASTLPATPTHILETLPEARLRLILVLKRKHWAAFQTGLLSPTGLRWVLEGRTHVVVYGLT